MYKSIGEIKREANLALSGRRGIYILMLTLSVALTSVFSITGFLSLVASIFTLLLQVGMYSFLLKLCCGKKEQAQFNDLFYAFRAQNGEVGKAIIVYLLQALYILPAAIIYVVLLVVFIVMGANGINDYNAINTLALSSGYILFAFVTLIAFFIYCLYISITYVMSFFVLLDYPNLTGRQIWKRASQLIKGNRLRYIGLEFSYILWLIIPIGLLVVGSVLTSTLLILLASALLILFVLWITPSMNCAQTIFYLDLVQHRTRPVTSEIVEDVYSAPVDTPEQF